MILPENIKIAVLDGFLEQDCKVWKSLSIIPVCNNLNQFKLSQKLDLKSVLHYDTGMNRLGINDKELEYIKNPKKQFNDEEFHLDEKQYNKFLVYRKKSDKIWQQNFNDYFKNYQIVNNELVRA